MGSNRHINNILFIISDQHRAISTGCYGSREVATPNMDALAAEGALFQNAYCQYPICTASRQSMLTGKYPGKNGTYQNYLGSIDPLQWTFPQALTQSGIPSILIGKGHCNQNGFLYRMESEEFAKQYWPQRILEAINPPHFGKDYRLNAQTAAPWPFDEQYLQSHFVETQAINFLRQAQGSPFFAYLSYDFPHPPFLPPQRHWDAVDPDSLELPPPASRESPHPYWGEALLGEPMLRNYLRGYYACLHCVDESIGRVLDAADSLGLLDDTMVIYTSDHGESGGHHGKYEKHTFYDTDIHVPLILKVPGESPRRVNQIVELVDLAPTILDYCGLDAPEDLDGASLRSLLQNNQTQWKNRAFCENYWPTRIERNGDEIPEEYGRALIQDGFKCCLGGNMSVPCSLFDLEHDPHELTNLWEHPAHGRRRADMVRTINENWCRIINPQESYEQLQYSAVPTSPN